MDRRSSFDFNYSRSELFNVVGQGDNRRAYLTAPDRYEIVVGVRLHTATYISAYELLGIPGYFPVALDAQAAGYGLTLCDENKVPFIEGVPAMRFSQSFIRQTGPTPNKVGPMIPLKIEARRVSLAASYVTRFGAAKVPTLWELFYR